jgi:hypothetical protein
VCNNGEFATAKERKTMQDSVKSKGQYWFSDFRKLHNEKLQDADFYFGQHTKEDEMGRACSKQGCRRKTQGVLEGRHERNMVLGRSRYRWAIILK